jgi:hypothetical protein
VTPEHCNPATPWIGISFPTASDRTATVRCASCRETTTIFFTEGEGAAEASLRIDEECDRHRGCARLSARRGA